MLKGVQKLNIIGAIVSILLLIPGYAVAQYSSSSYKVEETFIGSGGSNDISSENYMSRATLGDLGVGNTASSSYQSYGGFTTTNQEYIEFVVNGGTYNFGDLTPSTTGMGLVNFSVRTYLSSGYVIKVTGTPLKLSGTPGYTLNALTSPTASVQGTEQFGINLKDNSTPNIGAEPAQEPDSSFSYGQIASGYNTANLFKYINGDVIALSNQSTGKTTFNMSMIANVSSITPGGQYDTTLSLVVIPTF